MVAIARYFLALLVVSGFSAHADCTSILTKKVYSFRAYRLKRISKEAFRIKGVRYQIRGELGRSQARAYLATDPDKNLRLIKVFPGDKCEEVRREALQTLVYLSCGFTVPKVLDFECSAGRAIMVKEYFLGITYLELMNSRFPEDFKDLHLRRANEEMIRLTTLSNSHEVRVDNMLMLPTKQWILNDP